MCEMEFKVFGLLGHRLKESFFESWKADWSSGNDIRKIEVLNSDVTGTNLYSIVKITRNTIDECIDEIEGQISDGIFENMRTGGYEVL